MVVTPKLAIALIGLVATMLSFGGVASAGVVSPLEVTAHVQKAKHPAFTFTTTGRITFPSQYCLPGTTSSAYCVPLTAAVCAGKVSLTVKLDKDRLLAHSNKIIKRTTARVKSNCTYSITTKFNAKVFAAKHHFGARDKGASVKVSFAVKFLGNVVLNPKSARTQTVKVKLKNT